MYAFYSRTVLFHFICSVMLFAQLKNEFSLFYASKKYYSYSALSEICICKYFNNLK